MAKSANVPPPDAQPILDWLDTRRMYSMYTRVGVQVTESLTTRTADGNNRVIGAGTTVRFGTVVGVDVTENGLVLLVQFDDASDASPEPVLPTAVTSAAGKPVISQST